MNEEQPGVKVGEIKKALKNNERMSKTTRSNDELGLKEDTWDIYDSTLENFLLTFKNVLPEEYKSKKIISEKDFEGYLKKTLRETMEHDLTAIEFGGPGSNLFSGFSPRFFRQTIGICLKDIRNENMKEEDKNINHSIIEGDIINAQSRKLLIDEIKHKFGAQKTDLIISRMAGALDSLDKNGAILDRLIRDWYDLLNENGLMLIQIKYFYEQNIFVLVKKWAEAIINKFPEIDISVSDYAIRLHKRKGSPDELPNAYQLFNK